MTVGQFFSIILSVLPAALFGFLLIHTVIRKIEDRIQTALWYGLVRLGMYLVNIAWWAACAVVGYHLSL